MRTHSGESPDHNTGDRDKYITAAFHSAPKQHEVLRKRIIESLEEIVPLRPMLILRHFPVFA